ncbi:MAG: hypothetical protein EAZ17_08415 [Sphingobacteriales bacterium]|nr:MAG: hypothetical protein EAZ17_08415 [Sphingobacteriales bacterium]
MLFIESQYFPCVTVSKILSKKTHIGILLCEPFRKMSFQNRCIIPTANGLVGLSVPLVGGRGNRLPMGQVRIDNKQRWQTTHWRTITSAYNRSPFFEFYAHSLETMFHTPVEFLHEWNGLVFSWLTDQLKLSLFVENINMISDGHRLDQPLPSNYQEERFVAGLPVYQQVFQERHGFTPNVSSMDLLFCTGPKAGQLLKQSGMPNGF